MKNVTISEMRKINKEDLLKRIQINPDIMEGVYSGPTLLPIPDENCHLFRSKPATHSG